MRVTYISLQLQLQVYLDSKEQLCSKKFKCKVLYLTSKQPRINLANVNNQVNMLLLRSHQAEIIVVTRLIQGRNNATWVGVESRLLRLG